MIDEKLSFLKAIVDLLMHVVSGMIEFNEQIVFHSTALGAFDEMVKDYLVEMSFEIQVHFLCSVAEHAFEVASVKYLYKYNTGDKERVHAVLSQMVNATYVANIPERHGKKFDRIEGFIKKKIIGNAYESTLLMYITYRMLNLLNHTILPTR